MCCSAGRGRSSRVLALVLYDGRDRSAVLGNSGVLDRDLEALDGAGGWRAALVTGCVDECHGRVADNCRPLVPGEHQGWKKQEKSAECVHVFPLIVGTL